MTVSCKVVKIKILCGIKERSQKRNSEYRNTDLKILPISQTHILHIYSYKKHNLVKKKINSKHKIKNKNKNKNSY